MSTIIVTAAAKFAAARTTLVAQYGGGTTWTDSMWSLFYDWKWWAAGGSIMIICTAGIFMLGRARLIGVLMILGGLFLGAFFARIEHWIPITQHTVEQYEHPSPRGNPFLQG